MFQASNKHSRVRPLNKGKSFVRSHHSVPKHVCPFGPKLAGRMGDPCLAL